MSIPVKTNGKRNRAVGHKLERDSAENFRKVGFPHVVTSRQESRSRDNQKIDLINKDEAVNGRFPYNVQCKCVCTKVDYHKLLSEIPKIDGVVNVVLHRQTVKTKSTFTTKGQYAILHQEDFMKMVEVLEVYKKGYSLLLEQLGRGLDDLDRQDIIEELKALGL